MIKIGVNEPVLFLGASKNEHGTIELLFKEANAEVKKKVSMLDALSAGDDTSGDRDLTESKFMIFMPSTEYQNEQIAAEKRVANMMKFKNQMVHILNKFTKGVNIKFNPFKGIPITTEEQLLEKVMDDKIYKQLYDNIVDQMIEQSKKLTNTTKKLRLLCVRQSAEKHFNRLRENFLEDRPFLEDYDAIPRDASKMWVKAGTKGATTYFEPVDGYVPKFDEYEIKKGFDNPIASTSKAEDATNTPEEAAQVEGVFGSGAAEAPIDFSQPVGGGFGMPEEATSIPGLTEDKPEEA